jgi:hypothetical protein
MTWNTRSVPPPDTTDRHTIVCWCKSIHANQSVQSIPTAIDAHTHTENTTASSSERPLPLKAQRLHYNTHMPSHYNQPLRYDHLPLTLVLARVAQVIKASSLDHVLIEVRNSLMQQRTGGSCGYCPNQTAPCLCDAPIRACQQGVRENREQLAVSRLPAIISHHQSSSILISPHQSSSRGQHQSSSIIRVQRV